MQSIFSFDLDDNQDKLSDSSPGSVGAAVDAAAEELSKMTPEEVERQRAEWSQVCFRFFCKQIKIFVIRDRVNNFETRDNYFITTKPIFFF